MRGKAMLLTMITATLVILLGCWLTGCGSVSANYRPHPTVTATDTSVCASFELRDSTGQALATIGPFCYTYQELLDIVRGHRAGDTTNAVTGVRDR